MTLPNPPPPKYSDATAIIGGCICVPLLIGFAMWMAWPRAHNAPIDPAAYNLYTADQWPRLHSNLGNERFSRFAEVERRAAARIASYRSCDRLEMIGPAEPTLTASTIEFFGDCANGQRIRVTEKLD